MKALYIFLFALSLLMSANAHASGFDCRKAAMPSDYVICSSPDLLKANDALASNWFAARAKLDAVGKADLVRDQKAWLQTMTSDCGLPNRGKPSRTLIVASQQCVLGWIERRSQILNNVTDTRDLSAQSLTVIRSLLANPPAKLTDSRYHGINLGQMACWASEHDPHAAVRAFIDPIYGDFDQDGPICDDWKIGNKLPQIAPLLDWYADINGEGDQHPPCIGEIQEYFPQNIARIEWKAAIDTRPESPKDLAREELDFPDSLEHWGEQGVLEKQGYEQIISLQKKSLPSLEIFYEKYYNLDRAYAHHLAVYYMNLLNNDYLDHAPSDDGEFANSYENGAFTVDDVQDFLKSAPAVRRKYSYNSLDTLLKLAVVNDFSLRDIKVIVGVMTSEIMEDPKLPGKFLSDPSNRATQKYAVRETPLMKAAARPDVLALLLRANIWDVNAQNWFGKTALMYAVQLGDDKGVELLLAAKANPNLPTLPLTTIQRDDTCMGNLEAGQRTPLMYAAWHSTPKIIARLIQAGADLSAHDDQGLTAAYYLNNNDDDLSKDQMALAASELAVR